jgi:dTDP-4-amino-4,6-dideoxygalactose transaminase
LCGADVDFVDIEPLTWNMSVEALRTKLQAAAAADRLPDVVIPVHFAGQPCDMPAIGALAREFGFRVIEDASHAIGSHSAGEFTGACVHSDVVVFSFHPVKIVTTGEGGMLVTRDDEIAERARLVRSHGVTRDPALMHAPPDGPWSYEQIDLGYNFRLTDLQAALGTSQVARLDAFVVRRGEIAAAYETLLGDTSLVLPVCRADRSSAWHLYVVHTGDRDAARRRRALYDGLVESAIRPNVHYYPIHLQPFYRARGFRPGDFPQAEAYYAGALSLPMFAGLRDDEQRRVADRIHELLSD